LLKTDWDHHDVKTKQNLYLPKINLNNSRNRNISLKKPKLLIWSSNNCINNQETFWNTWQSQVSLDSLLNVT